MSFSPRDGLQVQFSYPIAGARSRSERRQRPCSRGDPKRVVRHRGRGSRRLLRLCLRERPERERRPLHRGRAARGRHGETVEFELNGQRFVGINGGPQFKFDAAVSFQVNCETQDEIVYY